MRQRERESLKDKWQLHTIFNKVDPLILEVICRNCGGAPLFCQQYFVNMLHDKFITIGDNGHVTPTDKFLVCNELNDWKSVPAPRLALKLTCTYLDKYLWDVQTKEGVKA